MSDDEFTKMLEDNGFSYHEHEIYRDCYVIENLDIVNYEPNIKNITVSEYRSYVCINFKKDSRYMPSFGLNLDMEGYESCLAYDLCKKFNNNNDLIEELHRLNSIGLNIKGANK